MVLRALEAGPHAARLVIEPAADRREVRRVAEAEQQLGRPVGLELRRVAAAVGVDLVVVAVDQVGLGVGVEIERQVGHRIGVEEVVVVQQDQELAAGRGGGVIRGDGDVAVLAAVEDPDAAVLGGPVRQLLAHVAVGAGVVNEDQLPVGDGLVEDAPDHRPEDVDRRIVDRHDDGEPRLTTRGPQRGVEPTTAAGIVPVHPLPGVIGDRAWAGA